MCKKLLLDVDGVLADFVRGMMKAHSKPWPYANIVGDEAWHLDKIWGISPKEFWEPCGYDFWYGLDKMPEADSIFQACVRRAGREQVCFLTSPCQTHGCMEGKLAWLSHRFPGIPVLFSVGAGGTPPKQFCAGRDAILVDDYSSSVDKFTAWGGAAFLVARPWNRNYDREATILSDLNEFLDEALFD